MENNPIKEKIVEAISFLQRGEKLALSMNPEYGYYVAFSGGKDSQVLLALVKLSGVKYRAIYTVTGNDSPENVYFIRKNYPDVYFSHPKKKFLKLVSEHGLPTMMRRFCCERLKEHTGVGCVVLTGVRAQESAKRAAYSQVMIHSRRKEHQGRPRERSVEEIERNQHQCIKGQDRLLMHPILYWTLDDIKTFFEMYNLPRNPCYQHTTRVGCMFCPFSSKKELEYYEKTYPLFLKALKIQNKIYFDKCASPLLGSADEFYEFWKSKKTVKKFLEDKQQSQLNLN